ncbi:hypothetical protein NUW58_g7566 [Xylaria curta]|uniref:Uncharacterized protein n=1 Tax=Xylaria curta TaxID=42375 RepID=A0ACC1NFZ8_9PEZI|nr:hypothetical protein NUW58_g7566 [Xylaria curta]
MACVLAIGRGFELLIVDRRIVKVMSVSRSRYRAVSDIPSIRDNSTRTSSGILGTKDHIKLVRAFFSWAAWSSAALAAAIVESVFSERWEVEGVVERPMVWFDLRMTSAGLLLTDPYT